MKLCCWKILLLFAFVLKEALSLTPEGEYFLPYPEPLGFPVLLIDWFPGAYFVCDRKEARVSSSILERKEALNSV
uniref:Uncharacterized protein n=1 Tax=Magallana gigas TaxID=29159 RepID=A0A8W8N4W2_MAGGI